MRHITVGRKYGEGKVAKIECIRNDRLQNIDIKDKCFLLIILNAGKLEFKVENGQFCAAAPAFASVRLWGINGLLHIPLKASTAQALRRLILNMTVLRAVLYGAGKGETTRCPPK